MRRRAAVVALAVLAGLVAGPGAVPGAPLAQAVEAVPETGEGCRFLVAGPEVTTPVGRTRCSGVRPGASVATPVGGCSLNFLFTGSDGHRYIGTAGHCFVGGGEHQWASGTGPVARHAGARFGEGAYAILQGPYDFALIRIDAGASASPEMCHFGGPTGLYTARELAPVTLHQYGNGLVLGNASPARSGVASFTTHDTRIRAVLPVTFGDSGSGVLTGDGRAIGVAVAIGGSPVTTAGVGPFLLTRLDAGVAKAEAALGITLTLETAPLRPLVTP